MSWEERFANGKSFMAPIERQLPGHVEREPWRCQQCNALIYNLDSDGHPAPGAPLPKYGGPDHPEICTLCFQMNSVIESSLFPDINVHPVYWKALHDRWKADRQNRNKLKPGENYMGGNA